MNSVMLHAMRDEYEKIASEGALIGGALGAGGMLLSGGMREWDQRHAENQAIKKLPPEQQAQAKEWVNSNRTHRMARLAVRASIGGLAGAGAGHIMHKGLELGTKTVAEGFKAKLQPALQEALAQGHAEGLRRGIEDSKPILKSTIQESLQGGLWRFINPFKPK